MSELKQLILEADDRPYRDVLVAEWGDATVRVRGLSGKDAEEFSLKFAKTDGEIPQGILVDLLVRTLEDPDTGAPIFEPSDGPALASKSGRVISKLFKEAQELSGLGDLDDAKND